MRVCHGEIISVGPDQPGSRGTEAPASVPVSLHEFDFMFPGLQDDPANLLPETPQTAARLRDLGASMVDPVVPGDDDTPGNSPIPAVYTYLGQFVDHDITLETVTGATDLGSPALAPLTLDQIRGTLLNTRTATLDLDSLYDDPAPRDPLNPARMRIGDVALLGTPTPPRMRPPGKDIDNDLPRRPRSTDPRRDREALIGDERNDENTVIGQLHVAFLKAHNRLVDEGRSFEEARRILRQHHQHIVVADYLPRICDPAIVDNVVTGGNRWFNPLAEPFFMPLEFSAAAFRFGHTMVRAGYDFNINFNLDPGGIPASLGLLFTFSALSGELGQRPGTPLVESETLPENWIVQWENLAGEAVPDGGRARRFDTRLAGPAGASLFALPAVDGKAQQGVAAMLSARNLLRGYLLRMPTGQAVAGALGVAPLTEQELRDAVGDQFAVLEAAGFHTRTPLWYYLLAEAAARAGGAHLGPVGSTLVAEVLVGLVRRSSDSVLRIPGWLPSMPALRHGQFELADLLRYARVLDGGAAPQLYTVVAGDTLSGIAAAKLGAAARWPEIFATNRAVIADPDRIRAGQVLTLPTGPAIVPQLRFHVVRAGDTLSGIAAAKLGDAARWPEIFTLNGSVVTNPDVIVVGQVLQLPSK